MKSSALFFLLLISISSIISSEEIDVLFNSDYYPFEFVNDKGDPDGFTIDLIYAIAREAAININLIKGNWQLSDDALYSGNIDLVPRYLPEKTAEHIITSDSLFSVYFSFIQKKAVSYKNFNSLRNRTVILSSGDSSEEYLISREYSAQEILTKSWMDSLNALNNDYGDYSIVSTIHYKLYSDEFKNRLHIINDLNLSVPFGFTAAKWDKNIINNVNNGISIIKVSGEFDSIYRKWFGNEENLIIKRSKSRDRISIYIITGSILVLVILFLINKRKVKS